MLKQKSDTLSAFKLFQSYARTQFNANIKVIQSSFGGEFRSFTKYINELGIMHRLTCPHTSHQNETLEIKHKQIMEMDLTFLAHAPLPNEIWDQNFTSSVYLINKLFEYALPKFIPPSFSLYNKLDT